MKFKLLLFVAIIAIAMIGIYTPEANAQGPGVTPYAMAKMWVGVTMYDKDSSGAKVDDNGELKSDMDLIMGVIPQATIGVKGSLNNVFVDIALMTNTPNAPFAQSGADTMQPFRFIVAMMYQVGGGNLLIGKHFTPYAVGNPNDPACISASVGWDFLVAYTLFDATREQIRFDYQGFTVGLYQNGQNESANADVLLPMVSAGYSYGNPGTPMNFAVHGLFQTYKNDVGQVDDGTGTMVANPLYGKGVNSYAVSGKFGMNMAPISFYVHGIYGVNPGDMGFAAFLGGSAKQGADKYLDTTVMAGHGGFTYAMGAMAISAGAGYKSITYDKDYADDPDTQMSYFVSLKYAVQPNFTITPVVQITDYMENEAKAKQGKATIFGVLFQGSV